MICQIAALLLVAAVACQGYPVYGNYYAQPLLTDGYVYTQGAPVAQAYPVAAAPVYAAPVYTAPVYRANPVVYNAPQYAPTYTRWAPNAGYGYYGGYGYY